MANVLITTLDNPYNPWTDWENWYNYDIQKGYDSCGQIARLAPSEVESLPEEYIDSLREVAIDSLIEMFPNIYTKISEDISDSDFKKLYSENLVKFNKFKDKAIGKSVEES